MNDIKNKNLSSAIKDFLAELEDLLENLNSDLLSLEDIMSEGKEDYDLINSLFRSFHTIKGLAGMLSLDDIGTLSHSLEDLLDAVRLGKVDLDQSILDILSKGIELLNKHAKVITGGGKVSGQPSFLKRIEKAMESSQEIHSGGLSNKVGLDDDILKTLTEYEEHRLKENIKNNKNLFLIRKKFSFDNFDTELNNLLNTLKVDGEVISTLPSSSSQDPTNIRFDLLWSTLLSKEGASSKFSMDPEEILSIEYEKAFEENKVVEPVSSTLRSLSDTVRVDIKRLDNLMNIVGELVIYKTHLGEISRDFINTSGTDPKSINLNKTVKSLERALNFLQKGVIETRMVPIGQMFGKLNRIVRKLSRELGKEIEFKIFGEDTELDKLVIEDMADPLLHLIRNAVDHGIEPPEEREAVGKPPKGLIQLSAYQKGNHIIIEIEDDGAGVDIDKIRKIGEEKGLLEKEENYDPHQILSLLFLPGFSTSEKVSEISGRGVGLDVVKNNVSNLRGMIDIESELGKGSRVVITLPMTLAIIQALMVKVCEEVFAIPINSVLESVKIKVDEIRSVENKEVIKIRNSILPLLRLDQFFKLERPEVNSPAGGHLYVVIVGLAEKRIGLIVDSLRGQQEIVIKTLGEILKPVKGIAGATELGDRRAILVLDVSNLIQEVTYSA